ncbi:hypothetical protein Tco_0019829 [Tanacetum coccineum]
MFELPDDSIGIYHRMFDFCGVQIPFSSFLLALIKHYKVHFSLLGPLGLNKVITFKVLCRSLQIVPIWTLFRVFQTLCKQCDWFSFAKRHAPSPVCIDDNPIDDLRPAASSFTMVDVCRWKCYGPTLQRLPFYCTPHVVAEAVIPDPTPKDLAVGTPSFKIVCLGLIIRYTRPGLFVGDDDESKDDDDACVEIPLVIPLCSAAGKGIMVDDAAASSSGVSRPRPSSRPAPSFKNVSSDAIHTYFFPFSVGPYYATYPEGDVAGNCEFTREDVLHCVMMSHGDELLTRYHGLNQSHHEYVLSVDSRLKGYEEKVANMTGLELQGLVRKFLASDEFSRVQGELLSLAASVGFERGFCMHRTKDEFAMVLKKMISEHATEPLSVILQLEPEKLVHLANVPIPRGTCSSPPIAKESTVTPVSESLKLSTNVNFTASAWIGDVCGNDALEILFSLHNGPTRGHHGANLTAKKIFDSGFFWPSSVKIPAFVKNGDSCHVKEILHNVLRCLKTPSKFVKSLNLGIDFLGPFPSSEGTSIFCGSWCKELHWAENENDDAWESRNYSVVLEFLHRLAVKLYDNIIVWLVALCSFAAIGGRKTSLPRLAVSVPQPCTSSSYSNIRLHPRVQARAVSAMVNISKNYVHDILTPYLHGTVSNLLQNDKQFSCFLAESKSITLVGNSIISDTVYHGGAGMTAAGLKVAGVGPPPIIVEEFSLKKLVSAIEFMLKPAVKVSATELAKAMADENGVKGAVDAFHKHFACRKAKPEPAELP